MLTGASAGIALEDPPDKSLDFFWGLPQKIPPGMALEVPPEILLEVLAEVLARIYPKFLLRLLHKFFRGLRAIISRGFLSPQIICEF